TTRAKLLGTPEPPSPCRRHPSSGRARLLRWRGSWARPSAARSYAGTRRWGPRRQARGASTSGKHSDIRLHRDRVCCVAPRSESCSDQPSFFSAMIPLRQVFDQGRNLRPCLRHSRQTCQKTESLVQPVPSINLVRTGLPLSSFLTRYSFQIHSPSARVTWFHSTAQIQS